MSEEMQPTVKGSVPGGCWKVIFKTLFNAIAERKWCHRGTLSVCATSSFFFTVIIYLFCVGNSYSVRMMVRANLPFGNGTQCSDCPTSSLSDLFVNDLEQKVFQIISSDCLLFSHPLVPPIRMSWFAGILVYHSNLSPKVVWKQWTFSFLKCVVHMMIYGRLTEASSMLHKVFRHVSNIM